MEPQDILSIIDFAGKQSQQNTVKNTNFHEFGLESDSQSVMFADLKQHHPIRR